ncbi:MalY/PatB family protein [Sporosalibacterium faouarense]|uniref:MalY/PatB family protein n=1 Tax=Sporosalibacterium faouarense TaxID=516123 RepID=UPI00192AABBE|nr:MalY/PatB family protein [Sporosalibacterium faouarense]
MKYNFDEIIDRSKYNSLKWLELDSKFGRDDILPMWVADMDFKSPQPIIDAICNRALHGVFGYTTRTESYFKTIAEWMERRHNWNPPEELLVHSPGVVFSLSTIVQEFTEPGDKIIVQPPVYYPFYSIIENNDRKVVLNPLKNLNGKYVMDYDDLERKIDENVKMLILCSPHNPIGRVWSREELVKLGEICRENNVRIVSDEIHCDLVLKGYKHTPFGTLPNNLSDNLITCFAPSKTFNIAGLQASVVSFSNEGDYVRYNEALDKHHFKNNNCFSIAAVEAGYKYGEEWLEQLLDYLEGNVEFLIKYIEEKIPQIKVHRPEGTFLAWLDCRNLEMNAELLSHFMINKAKVALDDGYWFGEEGKGFMRINFACPRGILEEGLRRIEEAISQNVNI